VIVCGRERCAPALSRSVWLDRENADALLCPCLGHPWSSVNRCSRKRRSAYEWTSSGAVVVPVVLEAVDQLECGLDVALFRERLPG
jgi:hypothetical protein